MTPEFPGGSAEGSFQAASGCLVWPPVGSRMTHLWFSVAAMDDESLRVSDADREQAIVALREHLLAGRLTLEEFSERVDAALRARFGGELARVQDDLPEVFVETAGSRRKPARFTAALLGHVARRGRLRLRRWAFAASAFGDLDFDLREATIDQRRTAVTVLGHRRDWGRDVSRPDAPAIRVRVLGFVGTVDIWRVSHDMRGSSYSDIF